MQGTGGDRRQKWTPLTESQIRAILERTGFGELLPPVRERVSNPPLPPELMVKPPEILIPGELVYRHSNPRAKVEIVELQAAGQAAGFNRLIEFYKGFSELQKRAQRMIDEPAFRAQEIAEGRRLAKLWMKGNPRPAPDHVPLHEPDVGAAGLP